MDIKEIGGFIELDRHDGSLYHDKAAALNCGRAALEYLIQAKKIKKIFLPYFCCDSVAQRCVKCGTEYENYHIRPDFRPDFDQAIGSDEWLYIINYYGQITDAEIYAYKEEYKRVIIDNSQAFFRMPVAGVDTLYTCRKFFGVPDGAFLYTNTELSGLDRDESFERINYILGRFERTASEFYKESAENNKLFADEPLKLMSKLTDNMLRAINYESVMQKRTSNFRFLHGRLSNANKLRITVPEGAYMYPFYCENGAEIRKILQTEKIYIPVLWPDVMHLCTNGSIEYNYASNILPLPVDQRYGTEEMSIVVSEVLKCLS